MDISQRQNLTQTMRQEQTMTQRQIQALELLFLPALELQAMIDVELGKNPVLDLDDPPEERKSDEGIDDDEWLERIMKLDEENRYIPSRNTTYSRDDEEKRRYYLESVCSEQTFQESLLDQLRFIDLSEEARAGCEVVISGLDDDGYLTSHPADLAMASGQSVESINQAIDVVKKLDPPGVAAKDLRERLLIQLERSGRTDAPAHAVVRDHLDEIARNHLPQVAKSMRMSIDELKEVVEEIQSLNPRLAKEAVSPLEYVNEEVVITEADGELKAKINNDFLPNLRISAHYRNLLKDPSTAKETKDYIKEKLRSGVFLINSIIQRQTTIKKIVDQIVKEQETFFKNGPDQLKPLTMAHVAKEIGVHETTVSRAVASKFLRCSHGLFPLKHFFSTGYATEDGESVSKNVVKDAIRKLVDNEEPTSPLSDSQMVKELKKQGYKVARRTVAKYRESMNILPSNLRRQY